LAVVDKNPQRQLCHVRLAPFRHQLVQDPFKRAAMGPMRGAIPSRPRHPTGSHGAKKSFVRRRLGVILRKQEKRSGTGRCFDDYLTWPNAFFATQGYSRRLWPRACESNTDEGTLD
jgi:hypothetical protein